MVNRIAASMALISFAVCLLVGGVEAGNPLYTTVLRALEAMMTTLVVGLVVGAMAKAMLDESMKMEQEKLKKNPSKTAGSDR